MARRTKKVGTAGRFGARYGVRIRKRIAEVEKQSKGWKECPKCKALAVKRKAGGIWICRHCDATFASGAYLLTPPVAVRREVAEMIAKAEAKAKGVEEKTEERQPEELPREEQVPEAPKKHAKKE
jgi:large subunit ribosomal protein L37Ae